MKKTLEDIRQYINEGVYDPGIFKAFFLAGGPGSGKTFVTQSAFGGTGLKLVNSDNAFERGLKKANLSLKMPDSEEYFRNIIRQRAKTTAGNMLDTYVQGRLGLIIDATGRDKDLVQRQVAMLRNIGYDCYMIFVNTSLDVALERNKRRERSVPEYITRKSHAIVQANIGKFQNAFGMGNMVIIDNSKDDRELTTQIMDRCSKAVRRLLSNKIKSYTAKRWMATERRLRRRR